MKRRSTRALITGQAAFGLRRMAIRQRPKRIRATLSHGVGNSMFGIIGISGYPRSVKNSGSEMSIPAIVAPTSVS
jgi:hypothetical protein